MNIKVKDIVIPKNKKTLIYNHKCMVVKTYQSLINIGIVSYYSLLDMETGDVRGAYTSIEQMIKGCELELA